MNIQNIHAVLGALSLEQVKSYMAQNGWNASVDGGRLNFCKVSEGAQENYAVFLPADSNHGRFRSLLQNMMFSLSVIEGREPYEIASDIGKIIIVSPDNGPAVDRVWLDRWLIENLPENHLPMARTSVKKFLFLIGNATVGNLSTETLVRASATLACHLVQQLDDTVLSPDQFYGLIRTLFANVKVDLPANSEAASELWKIARNDDVDVPMDTLDWLQSRSTKR